MAWEDDELNRLLRGAHRDPLRPGQQRPLGLNPDAEFGAEVPLAQPARPAGQPGGIMGLQGPQVPLQGGDIMDLLRGPPAPIGQQAPAPVPLPQVPRSEPTPVAQSNGPGLPQTMLPEGETQLLGTVPVSGGFPGSPASQLPSSPADLPRILGQNQMIRMRTPTADNPSTWERADVPQNMLLRHGRATEGDLIQDTPQGRQANAEEALMAMLQRQADRHNNAMAGRTDLDRMVLETPMSINNQFRALLPGALNNFQRMEQQRLENFQQLGAPAGAAGPGMPAIQGDIANRANINALAAARELGIPGTSMPGAIANAASDSQNRTRENERYGPEARYDSFYNQAYGSFPPGTPHDARVRQLTQQGMPPPQFLTGQGRPQVGPGGVPRPIGPVLPGQGVVDRAFEQGMTIFPMNAQGVRDVSNQDLAHQAITNILANIPDQALRENWPAIQARLTDQFGANNMLDNWLNASNNIYNYFSRTGQDQQRQVQRLLQMGGMRQTPISPMSTGASPMQRFLSAVTPTGAINQIIGR